MCQPSTEGISIMVKFWKGQFEIQGFGKPSSIIAVGAFFIGLIWVSSEAGLDKLFIYGLAAIAVISFALVTMAIIGSGQGKN